MKSLQLTDFTSEADVTLFEVIPGIINSMTYVEVLTIILLSREKRTIPPDTPLKFVKSSVLLKV